MIVLDVPAGGLQLAIALFLGDGVAVVEDVEFLAPVSGPREATEYNAGIRLTLKADTALVRFREAAASDALAALMTVGSPAMARLLAEQFPETQKLPVIGVIPGAEPLRAPLNPYVYHLRAGDLEQYRKLAEHAATTGQ